MRKLGLLLATVALLASWGSGARATFPGANGKIAFVRNNDIYVMDADGSNVTRPTSTPGTNEIQPTISPDGKKIAFTSDGPNNGGFDIWVMGIDGSNPTPLTNDSVTDQNPTWSPDGAEIAFETGRTGLTTTIWVMNADGSNQHKVIDRYPTTNVSDPAWSPDGSKLAYILDNPGPRIAVASAAAGSGETVLTDAATYARFPSWSPDGSKIVYQHTDPYGGAGTDIFTVDVASASTSNLTSDAPVDESPAFSPDGTAIVYAANINGQLKVFRMSASGSNKVNLTALTGDPSASDRNPDWGPAAAAPPPPLPSLSIGDVSVTEGNSGTPDAMFTVSLSAPASTDVSVDYTTADGTATAPGDYHVTHGTLVIPHGSISGTITVPVVGDTLVERDETFTVSLANPAGATIATATGTGTILNDDAEVAQPSLSIADVSGVPEGNSGTSGAMFTVSLSAPANTDVSVDYATADGTATAPGDYLETHGTLAVPIGSTSGTIAVQVVGDTVVEPDETFTVILSNPANATLARAQATGTILNDDTPPPGGPIAAFVAASNPAGCEQIVNFDGSVSSDNDPAHHLVAYNWAFGDGASASGPQASHAYTKFGSYRARLTVTDDSTPAKSDSVIQTVDVSVDRPPVANAGGPYTIELGDPLTLYGGASTDADIGCGDSLTTYAWDLNDDGRADATGVSPTLSAVALAELNLGVGHHQAALTVTDSFGQIGTASVPFTVRQAQLSIGDVSVTEGNSGTTTATFPVSLSFASTHTVTVQFATADGTAAAPSDYQAASGTLTFAPSITTQNISVTVNGDTALEPDETFNVDLSSPTGAAIANGQAVGTILNDDLPVRTLRGSVTMLTPFAPGGGPGESPFAGVQVFLGKETAAAQHSTLGLTLVATTDAQGHYSAALGAYPGCSFDCAVVFVNPAGGLLAKETTLQPAPATTTVDARLGTAATSPPQFVFGRVLAPAAGGVPPEQLTVKVFDVSGALLASSAPLGLGSYGDYRLAGHFNGKHSLIVTLYQDGIAVDSTLINYNTTDLGASEIEAPDLHGLQ
jgi:Tol biopolymer transport system component